MVYVDRVVKIASKYAEESKLPGYVAKARGASTTVNIAVEKIDVLLREQGPQLVQKLDTIVDSKIEQYQPQVAKVMEKKDEAVVYAQGKSEDVKALIAKGKEKKTEAVEFAHSKKTEAVEFAQSKKAEVVEFAQGKKMEVVEFAQSKKTDLVQQLQPRVAQVLEKKEVQEAVEFAKGKKDEVMGLLEKGKGKTTEAVEFVQTKKTEAVDFAQTKKTEAVDFAQSKKTQATKLMEEKAAQAAAASKKSFEKGFDKAAYQKKSVEKQMRELAGGNETAEKSVAKIIDVTDKVLDVLRSLVEFMLTLPLLLQARAEKTVAFVKDTTASVKALPARGSDLVTAVKLELFAFQASCKESGVKVACAKTMEQAAPYVASAKDALAQTKLAATAQVAKYQEKASALFGLTKAKAA